jgi:hypothetical protein
MSLTSTPLYCPECGCQQIEAHKPGEYEIDHLVSLELGGSSSIRNLWPQSYVTEPQNAHVKDKLENVLHEPACSGKLSLEEAQKAIATPDDGSV